NFSSSYTPEQNGVAKRKNRTLIKAAKIMLNGLVLLKNFWTEAVRIACYTQNKSIIVKRYDRIPYEIFRERVHDISYFHMFGCLVFIHNHKDHLGKFDVKADDGYFLGYSFNSKCFRVFNIRIQQIKETYHVTFDESIEAIRFTNTSIDEIRIDDSSIYSSDEYHHKDDPSRQYQPNSDISYYVILYGRLLIKLTQEKYTLEVIALNEQDNPRNEVVEGLPDQENTEGTQEHISQNQHIELLNIIGDPGEGILVRSMATKLTTASTNKCLFVDFLSEIEPKKEEEINYDETFAVMARIEAIRIFLAFATYMNFIVFQMDVKSVFLNGKLKEVYVKQPPGFKSNEFPDYVCMLDKALYELKQAPRDDKGISICQEQYTRNLLKKYEISDSSSVKTLMVPPNNLGPDLAGKPVNETLYKGIIRSLMYLTAIRPDIQFSTILCARYHSSLKESHLIAVKRIFMYLKGTSSLGSYYPKCLGFDLKGYSDSDYAGCNMERKSTSGACQILGGKLVCWSAKKQQSVWIALDDDDDDVLGVLSLDSCVYQKMWLACCDSSKVLAMKVKRLVREKGRFTVAMSLAEAKYVAAAECCANILWMKSQLSDYDIHYKMCTAIAYDPNPLINDSEARPLKEYLIKFLVMNGKKPLIFDYKTFIESTRLDYAKGTYVSHPSPEAVKAELAKIVENRILLDRTHVLKTTFPVAWRIMFNFLVHVLSRNYSSTKQVNSIHQLIAYRLLTGTKVDIGEVIFNDLVTRLTNKSRQKYVSYLRFVSYALAVLLGSDYTHDESFGSSPTIPSNSNFSKDPSKVTPIKLTAFMVAGPEASGSLPQKRKKPKSKKALTETQINKQLAGTGLPSTQLDEGTRKSQLLLEGTTTDPKDSGGNIQSADKRLPSTVSNEGTVKTMLLPEGSHGDKDSEGFKQPTARLRYRSLIKNKGNTSSEVEPDSETLQLTTFADVQALLLSDDEMVQESDEDG
ncbi:retrovirus-related pol polyprotein from transposon TNT 1-94, partial [Tanacetum coccineum]